MGSLILEDESAIAESLYQLLLLLEYHPYQPVDNPDDAIKIIKRDAPDLIILDLDLKQNRSGLEVIAYIEKHKLNIPFIVLAANSDAQTLASVEKHRPCAYLVKPFVRESLFATIELLRHREPETNDIPDHEIFVKTGSKYEKLDLTDLIYVKASGKYIELHFRVGKRLIRMSLSAFIRETNNIKFMRVHKSYAVNPEFITSFTAEELLLENCRIPIGRSFMPDINTYLRYRSPEKKKLLRAEHSVNK